MSASTNWEDVYRTQTARIAELERENAALRNEIARLNNQTNWVCKCGGTDCAGQKENAALRAALDSAIVLLRRWNKNDVTDDVVIETRKAIDAARKEAQP